MSTPPTTTSNNNNEHVSHRGQMENLSTNKDTLASKVSSDGLSMPSCDKPKHLSRSLSYEKFLSENNERVVLNVGGKRFETYTHTLTRFPDSLVGVMFAERNKNLRKPDCNGEYYFDRSYETFEIILNYFRTGVLVVPPHIPKKLMKQELDFWQIPTSVLHEEERLGNVLTKQSMQILRQKLEPTLGVICAYITAIASRAAEQGLQSVTIEFKPGHHQDFYSFLSNFSHRELLLHDLIAQNLDVSFSDMTSGQGHSYILNITLWNRYTKQKVVTTLSACTKILDELRQGVEVKTTKNDHILSIRKTWN
jgi:hypothetical protein